MRRAFVIFIPALLLALLFVASRATANLHYVASGAPGDLLYAAGFDGFLDEWRQYDDGELAAKINDGVMELTNNSPGNYGYTLASPYFGDFNAHISTRVANGPVNNGFGLIYRFQKQTRTTEATWRGLIMQQFEQLFQGTEPPAAYYMFLISSDGYYAVLSSVNGAKKELSTWIPSDAVHQGIGAINQLGVVASSQQFQFTINNVPVKLCVPDNSTARSLFYSGECVEGKMLPTLADSSVGSGQIGVVTQAFDDPGVVVDFDNLVVIAPQPS